MRNLTVFFTLFIGALLISSCSVSTSTNSSHTPNSFVELGAYFAERDIPLLIDLRYLTNDNFVGRRVDGYQSAKLFITEDAAQKLVAIALRLQDQNLGFKVFDAYRPQQAVDHFVRWALDLDDTLTKTKYYPNEEKSTLFDKGYIAERSGHSRGSTIDLTLINLTDSNELDMGTPWDFFDITSWPSSESVTVSQRANRELLRDAMLQGGFSPIVEEWWHFTLENEPFPDTYFDFEIR